MKEFLWIPGNGYDEEALLRIREHFRRPSAPMGEAWFMGVEREMYDHLCGDLSQLPVDQLNEPLEEISGGTRSFGPLEEWSEWYHYLLGQTIPRSHERYVYYLLEDLITAFISQYPEGVIREPYRGFQEDALRTLGSCIMDKQCWNGREIVIGCVLWPSNNNPKGIWLWDDASGDFSASMFYCLKYLPTDLISGWLKSVFAIESPHWRAQLMVWLIGAHKMLNDEIRQPSEFDERPQKPYIGWSGSHVLAGEFTGNWSKDRAAPAPFLHEKNRVAALKAITEQISKSLYIDWLGSIAKYDYLEGELGDLPDRFANLYL